MRFMDDMEERLDEEQAETRTRLLLSLRGTFRRVLREQPRTGLRCWLWVRGVSSSASPLAVWLLASCSTMSSTKGLRELARAPLPVDFARHYAKGLWRLDAYDELQLVAAQHPEDAYLRRLAALPRVAPFEERLQRFASHVGGRLAPGAAGLSRMPLWFSTEFWRGRRARSARDIRAVLEHIRFLLQRR